jgi:phenylpropionate dioxygenase-like ring-hydroxylating dioxygenase large terminal subunit
MIFARVRHRHPPLIRVKRGLPTVTGMAERERRVLRVTEEPELRRYWYPLARADAVADEPVARILLGVEVVLWRPGPGRIAGAVDRCPHRDARLSGGWLDGCALVCPYHGWEYGPDGAATRIPQLDDGAALPPAARLDAVRVAERYGWVWACLVPEADEAQPLPTIPGAEDPSWRVVREPESEWACPLPMLVENNLDPAHIAFVHRTSFGTPASPRVPVPDVARTATGMCSAHEVEVQSRPGEAGETVRRTVTTVIGPALLVIDITYPDGVRHVMLKACTPVGDTTTRQLQVVLRNDGEADRPAADIVAFDAQVWAEDRVVLESAHHDYPLALTAQVHLRIDRATIEYRRMLAEMVDGAAAPAPQLAVAGA